ncbi:hypothetical protein D9M73_290750 [compost metagenome]
MTHTLTFRCSYTSNVTYYRLSHVRFDEFSSFFFRCTADLTDHDDSISIWIVLEQLKSFDLVHTWDWVTTNTDTSRLT